MTYIHDMPRQYWFGRKRDAPLWDDMVETATPTASACVWCDEPIVDGDDGLINWLGQISHTDCMLVQGLGGVNHQRGLCRCFGGNEPSNPPDMSPRRAAREAVQLFYLMHGKDTNGDPVKP